MLLCCKISWAALWRKFLDIRLKFAASTSSSGIVGSLILKSTHLPGKQKTTRDPIHSAADVKTNFIVIGLWGKTIQQWCDWEMPCPVDISNSQIKFQEETRRSWREVKKVKCENLWQIQVLSASHKQRHNLKHPRWTRERMCWCAPVNISRRGSTLSPSRPRSSQKVQRTRIIFASTTSWSMKTFMRISDLSTCPSSTGNPLNFWTSQLV